MKTGVWISLILLAMTIGLGVWSGEEVRALSEEYAASAEELRTLGSGELGGRGGCAAKMPERVETKSAVAANAHQS